MLHLFAETLPYTYSVDSTSSTSSVSAGTFLAIYGVALLLAIPLIIIPLWKIFKKCGKPGWAAIVPVYNTWILFEITGFPGWWVLLSFIPFVNIFPAVVSLIATFRLAKIFGKGAGFGLGLIFFPFIFLPILGYGKATPSGTTPGAKPVDSTPAPQTPPTDVPSSEQPAPATTPAPVAPDAQPPTDNNQPPQPPTPPVV
jgi:hypothetical protein